MATKKKNTGQPVELDPQAKAVGERLMAALKDELCNIKNPGNPKQNVWGTLSEIQQDEILERFSRRITHELRIGYDAILANGFPAVHAHLAKVAFSSKGIQGALEISRSSSHRHELADFSGLPVLVILADDLEEYLDSMKMVTPDKDQKDLPLDQEPDAESDPRTMDELKAAAYAAAETLGEDIEEEPEGWDRERLIDYVHWAESKVAENKGEASKH